MSIRQCLKFFICASLFLFSCSGKKTSTEKGEDVVVATSSWTAAYAQAAGAKNVVLLAPLTMSHPSEYELRPGDIPKLKNATLIVYAGYEVMTAQLQKGLDIPSDKLYRIDTDYNYQTIAQTVMDLAFRLGTEEAARENLLEIQQVFLEAKKMVNDKRLTGQKVVVHRFHVSIAQELGLVPALIFGPVAPEAKDLLSVSKADVSFILDNRHNPVGLSFREVLPYAYYRQLLNFPGQIGTKTLSDVIRYNVTQITGSSFLKQ